MFEDQPLIAGENQGLGCPLFDALPHRHIVAGDKHIIELDVRDDMRGPGEAVHGVCDVRVYDRGRDNRLRATATVTSNFLDGSDFAHKSD